MNVGHSAHVGTTTQTPVLVSGVAAHECGSDFPCRNGHGEVPWRDDSHHSDGSALRECDFVCELGWSSVSKQSASFAFLDANRTGTVVTAIQGRDYARIYVKDVERGTASVALSPEEQTAVERAMGR